MPYVMRDGDGRVVAVSETPLAEGGEFAVIGDPELLAFLGRTLPGEAEPFLVSDLALIRVIEDVVEVLVRRNLLALTDLPAAAQEKLLGRRAMRGWLAGISGMVGEDDGKVI